ncbi:flagellar hook-length control protein FliK [Modestobacter marinus]|uniref:flagellar hook-length control protein FliK n=1 Tax=Modestobacter marinus TaxID=477641 RepID=UPI001C97B2FE|nr:flagellar hook-length control protein FliK [Modestobacter marinus]
MTAPTVLPALPAVPATAGPTGSATTGGGSPAFASVLDDALTSGGQQSGPAAEDTPEEDRAPGQDGTVVPVAVLTLPPWLLLSAAPASATPVVASPGTAPDAVASTAVAPDLLPAAGGPATAPSGPVPAYAAVADAAAPVPAPPVPTAVAAALAGAVVSSGSSPADVPAGPATAADAVVSGPALPLPAPAETPADADADTGADDGGGDPAGAAAPEQPAPDADPLAAFGTTSAPAPATATAGTSTAPSSADADQPVATQLGRQLAVLTEAPDGTQTMTLVITPDELGPVSIQATITDGTIDLTLLGAHEHGRQALAEALPDLRRELETAGLSVSRLEVGTDAGRDGDSWQRAGQQQLPDPRGGSQGQPGRAPADGRGWVRDDDQNGAGTPVRTADPSTSRGVDVRV